VDTGHLTPCEGIATPLLVWRIAQTSLVWKKNE
jgi:hypothetical protein